MFQAHTPDDGSIFLPFSVYSDRSHSSFPFFVFLFFFFIFFILYFLFFFLFSLLLCFIQFFFPFPFLVFLPPPTHAQVPAERKKVLSASRWMAAKYKESKLAPARISRKLPWKVCQSFWKRVVQIDLPSSTFLPCPPFRQLGPLHIPQSHTSD
jgi:hypothetical protein